MTLAARDFGELADTFPANQELLQAEKIKWLRVSWHGGWGDAEGGPLWPDEALERDLEEEIEALIIPAVAELHDAHIAKSNSIKEEIKPTRAIV